MRINPELIEGCQKDDRISQKTLYLKLLPYLRAVCRRYIFEKSFLNDVLQESFLLIFKNINSFDPLKGEFLKWAVRICINSSLNFNKKPSLSVEEFTIGLHDIPQIPKAYEELSNEAILDTLKHMPPQYFLVFNLYIIDGYDHNEIAEMLNITALLSRKRLSRARGWIKKAFRDNAKEFNFQSINLRV